jgi:hypothetical protein
MDETPSYNDNAPNIKVVPAAGAKSVNDAKTRTGDYRASLFLSCT